MERPNFCTTVFPYEYDYVSQFEEAVKSANKYHKTIHKECPPPYYPFDMGKLYGLVATVQEVDALRARLAECERVAEALAGRVKGYVHLPNPSFRWTGENLDKSALAAYEQYKSSHEVKK